jgi:hypothetical protein
LDGLIEYSSSGRFTEFYNFQNYTLTNDTTNINISLYNLNSSRGQAFRITYKDDNFVPVDGAIIQLQRKYVDEGLFRTVEIPKTGAEGYTIAHLVVNDVIYNIIIIKEGVTLASFIDVVADCQNPSLESCLINLNSFGSSTLPESFSSTNDISFTLTFDKPTRTVESIYTITSGATETVNLDVTLFDRLGNTSVCNDTLVAAGGTLSCVVPTSFGNSSIITKLHKGGEIVGEAIISLKQDPEDVYGSNLIFVALVGFILILGVSLTDNPMIMGVGLVLATILLFALNIVYSPSIVGTGATVLFFIVAIIIILIKGSDRQ